MVMLDANTGKYLADLPIGQGCDGATFNPKTLECFSSQRDGTLTVIKETPGVKVFLIAAEYGPTPTPPVPGGRGGRGPMVPGSFTILEVGK